MGSFNREKWTTPYFSWPTNWAWWSRFLNWMDRSIGVAREFLLFAPRCTDECSKLKWLDWILAWLLYQHASQSGLSLLRWRHCLQPYGVTLQTRNWQLDPWWNFAELKLASTDPRLSWFARMDQPQERIYRCSQQSSFCEYKASARHSKISLD